MSTETVRQTRQQDRVGFPEKMALGVGGLPMFLGLAAVGSFATPFYQMTLKLDPVWLAAALTVPRFLDAFIDPLVGRFSDNFHSRFGRRRPLVAMGAVVQALAFGMIWMVPTSFSQIALTAWLVATQIVFYIGYSFSFVGSIIGLIWGFVTMFVAAWIFVVLYNRFAGPPAPKG